MIVGIKIIEMIYNRFNSTFYNPLLYNEMISNRVNSNIVQPFPIQNNRNNLKSFNFLIFYLPKTFLLKFLFFSFNFVLL